MSWRIHHCCRGMCVYSHMPPITPSGMAIITSNYLAKLQSRTFSLITNNVTYQTLSRRECCSLLTRGNLCRPLILTRCSYYHKESGNTPRNGSNRDDKGQEGPSTTENNPKISFFEARRKGLLSSKKRMSPFQRITDMMKEQNLSTNEISNNFGESVVQSRLDLENGDQTRSASQAGKEEDDTGVLRQIQDTDEDEKVDTSCHSSRGTALAQQLPKSHSSVPLAAGEFVIISGERSKKSNLRVLKRLHQAGSYTCKWGSISHCDIIGRSAGRVFRTHLDFPLVIRRPSLEEYVLLMKRAPTILYPKEACTILMMADISPGDVVLEAGTGSGAMTLFLSRAVGSSGHVFTFEARADHHKRGIDNWQKWKTSWDISHTGSQWPENVSFHNVALQQCTDVVGHDQVDGVILDVGSAGHLLPILCKKLKSGKAIVVYVPQITQAVDVSDAIQIHQLPLILESVLEVTHKSWHIKVADIHNRSVLQSSDMNGEESRHSDTDDSEKAKEEADVKPSSNLTNYLCRPHHVQMPHTGFLLQLRKIITPSENED